MSADLRSRYAEAAKRIERDRRRRHRQLRPVDRSEQALIEMAMDGLLVAEELPTKTRERLFCELHILGWTDREIAEHTRTTEYTTVRIRDRLGLLPNPPRPEEMTA